MNPIQPTTNDTPPSPDATPGAGADGLRLNQRRRTMSFRAGFAATFGADVLSKVLGAVQLYLLIRHLDTNQYAFFTLFATASSALSISASGGVRQLYLRNEAERVSRKTPGGSNFLGSAVACIVLVLFASLVALGVSAAAGITKDDSSASEIIALSAVFGAAWSVIELAILHYQAHKAFGHAARINLLRNALLVLSIVFVVFATNVSGATVAGANVLAVIVLAAWVATAVGRSVPVGTVRGFPRLLLNSETGWLTVFYLASAGFLSVDVLIVNAFLSNEDVGAFGTAVRYYNVVLGAFPALVAVFRVRTSQSDLIDSQAAQRTMLISWFRRVSLPVVAVAAVGAGLAPVIMPIINSGRYADAIPIFQLLLIAALASYLWIPVPSLFMAQRRFKALALTFTAAVVVNAVGDAVAANLAGVIAVAVSSVGAYLVLVTLQTAVFLRRAPDTADQGLPPVEPK